MIYLTMFAASTFLAFLASRSRGALEVVLIVSALLLPCLLAGFRDETVGVDVLSYAKWMCLNADSMGFVEFMAYEADIAAPGWNAMTWASTRLLGGLSGYLFVIEACCVVPVYLTLRRLVPGWEWLGLLLWFLGEYAFTYNGMRQAVAMAWVYCSIFYVVERRPWKFLLCVGVGMLFHQTAAVGLVLYPLSLLVSFGGGWRTLFGKWRRLVLAALVAVAIVALFALGPRLVVLASVLKDSYSYQVQHMGENDVSIAALYLFAMTVLVWLISRWGDMREAASWARVGSRRVSAPAAPASSGSAAGSDAACEGVGARTALLSLIPVVVLVGSLLWQLNYVASTLGRVGYYGTMFVSLWGGVLVKSKRVPRGAPLCLVAFMLVYFVVMFLVLGMSGVWPYTSAILGIGF